MSDSEKTEFGSMENDLEGQMVTRKVQDGGRINFPDEYLEDMGVGKGSRVFIVVRDGHLEVMEASAENLAITAITECLKEMFGVTRGD
jgi:bifunctional DNA-binding transcriptional regulator/antitoxin component of YhaV-PrlF toxin-antitoxin module